MSVESNQPTLFGEIKEHTRAPFAPRPRKPVETTSLDGSDDKLEAEVDRIVDTEPTDYATARERVYGGNGTEETLRVIAALPGHAIRGTVACGTCSETLIPNDWCTHLYNPRYSNTTYASDTPQYKERRRRPV